MANYEWNQDEKSGRNPRLTALLYDTYFMSRYTKSLFAHLTEEEETDINRENKRCPGLGDTFFTEDYLVFDRNLFRYEDILNVELFRWNYFVKGILHEAKRTYISLIVKDNPRTLFRRKLRCCHLYAFDDNYEKTHLDNFLDELRRRCGNRLVIEGPYDRIESFAMWFSRDVMIIQKFFNEDERMNLRIRR